MPTNMVFQVYKIIFRERRGELCPGNLYNLYNALKTIITVPFIECPIMLDSKLRTLARPFINKTGKFLADSEVNANTVTVIGFCFSLGCFAALVLHFYTLALILLLLSRFSDSIDGAIARHSPAGPTDYGGFLDIVTDMILYSGFVFFFALGRPDMLLPAAFLLFSFMGTSTTFLSYAIMAEKNGLDDKTQDKKSFFYLEGLTEGTETIIAFALICLFPAQFPFIAVIFGLMCWMTTYGRIRKALQDFKADTVAENAKYNEQQDI